MRNGFAGALAAISIAAISALPAMALTPADCTEAHFAKVEAFADRDLTLMPVHFRDNSPFVWAGETAAGAPCAGLSVSACLDKPRSATAGDVFRRANVVAAKILEDGDLACVFVDNLDVPVWMRRQDLTNAQGPDGLLDWYGTWESGGARFYLWSKVQFNYMTHTPDAGYAVDDDTLNALQGNAVDLTAAGDHDLVLVGYDWHDANGPDGPSVNSGFIAGRVALARNVAVYRQFDAMPDTCAVVIVNLKTELLAREIGVCGGVNTTFSGHYAKAF